MDSAKVILWASVFVVGIFAENNDFRIYGVFKTDSVSESSDSKCSCTRNATESSFGWGAWSRCQAHSRKYWCHQGLQLRMRPCTKSSEGPLCREREWKYCYHEKSCNGQWQQWTESLHGGECSHKCGGGVRMKVRICTLDHKIGLFCKGQNRSPYDLKKEACNTHRCPKWSDWKVVFTNCSSTSPDGIITTKRECEVSGSTGERCGPDKNMTEESVIRNCDYRQMRATEVPTEKGKVTHSEFSPNKLTYVLLAILLLLMTLMLLTGMCICYKKRRHRLENLRHHSDGIFRPKSIARGQTNMNSPWLSRQKYDEIDVRSQYSNSIFDTKISVKQYKDQLQTRKESLTSFDEQSATYTTMSGSSSSGSGETPIKTKLENPEFPKNIVVRLPIQEGNERYTSSPSPHSKRYHDSNQRKQQLRADGYIESSFLGFNKTASKERSKKRPKREMQAKNRKEDDDDFEYLSNLSENSRSNSRNESRRSSEHSRHLYAEIREFKPGDAPGKVPYTDRESKLFASREVISAL